METNEDVNERVKESGTVKRVKLCVKHSPPDCSNDLFFSFGAESHNAGVKNVLKRKV